MMRKTPETKVEGDKLAGAVKRAIGQKPAPKAGPSTAAKPASRSR